VKIAKVTHKHNINEKVAPIIDFFTWHTVWGLMGIGSHYHIANFTLDEIDENIEH